MHIDFGGKFPDDLNGFFLNIVSMMELIQYLNKEEYVVGSYGIETISILRCKVKYWLIFITFRLN